MEYLYIRFMSTHSFEELRKVYVKALAEKEENEKYDEELAEQMEKYGGGFNPVQIEEVMKAFKEAK